MSKFLFWFDDAYGVEHMFTLECTEEQAIRRGKELCNQACDCVTVTDYATDVEVFNIHDYYAEFESEGYTVTVF